MTTMIDWGQLDALKRQMQEREHQVKALIQHKYQQLQIELQAHQRKVQALADHHAKLESEAMELRAQRDGLQLRQDKKAQMLRHELDRLRRLVTRQRELTEQRETLERETVELNEAIVRDREKLERQRQAMQLNVLQDITELEKYQQYLGMKIVVESASTLRFVFVNIDPNALDTPFSVVIDVGGDNYRVIGLDPDLGAEMMSFVENEFNDHKLLVKFLKTVRTLFRESIEG